MKYLYDLNIIRLFVFLCFYAAISYGVIAWKYISFFKATSALRAVFTLAHFLIVISNITGFLIFITIDRHTPFSVYLSSAGLFIATIGAGFLLWAIFALGTATLVPPVNGELITKGPFAFTSHPTYAGGVIAGFGLAVWSASMLGLVYSLIIMLSLIILSIVEERDLVRRFGDDYLDYKKNTFTGKMFSLF